MKRDKIFEGVMAACGFFLLLAAACAKTDHDRDALMPRIMAEVSEIEVETEPEPETDAMEVIYQKLAEYAAQADVRAETMARQTTAAETTEILTETQTEEPATTETTAEMTAETTTEPVTEIEPQTEPPTIALSDASTTPTAPEMSLTEEIPVETEIAPTEPINANFIDLSDEDKMYLVKTASCEAGNQGVYGMALIMRVVLNRSFQRGMSIHDVLYEPEQFNCVYGEWWSSGYIADGVYDALALVQSGWDDSYGATFFCTPQRNTWHMSHLTFLFQYGNMQFYK